MKFEDITTREEAIVCWVEAFISISKNATIEKIYKLSHQKPPYYNIYDQLTYKYNLTLDELKSAYQLIKTFG